MSSGLSETYWSSWFITIENNVEFHIPIIIFKKTVKKKVCWYILILSWANRESWLLTGGGYRMSDDLGSRGARPSGWCFLLKNVRLKRKPKNLTLFYTDAKQPDWRRIDGGTNLITDASGATMFHPYCL